MGSYMILFTILALAGYAKAFFRMSCPGRLVRERIDPIVNPGKVADHVHTISGGSGFSATMTFQDARASKCSSLYYLQRPDPSTEKLYAYPEGFRMIAGDSTKRNGSNDLATKGVSFACLGANQPETNNLPNYNCPHGLRAQIFFPSCWNGKDVDSTDHKSHMSYPSSQNYDSGPCPAGFPVHMVSIFFEVLYDTNLFADQWTKKGAQHPFVFANGDATGYGFHGDFLNGWDVNVLQNAVDDCTDASGQVEKCSYLSQYTARESQQCQIPTIVKEAVDGSLAKLPGCNTPTFGPDRAVPTTCGDNATLGSAPGNFIDLTASGWSYVGCGTDDIGDRAFLNGSQGTDTMTVQTCIAFCNSAGMPYVGLEYGRECWCTGKLNPKYAPKEGIIGSCNYKCAGDHSQICGGVGAMSIYHKCDASSGCKN
ncbi:hypothetical protein GQ44DRAFT_657897, partial [Phaeosphaeriaceae sp. PMI808]